MKGAGSLRQGLDQKFTGCVFGARVPLGSVNSNPNFTADGMASFCITHMAILRGTGGYSVLPVTLKSTIATQLISNDGEIIEEVDGKKVKFNLIKNIQKYTYFRTKTISSTGSIGWTQPIFIN